jgi:hypothetical protein
MFLTFPLPHDFIEQLLVRLPVANDHLLLPEKMRHLSHLAILLEQLVEGVSGITGINASFIIKKKYYSA